jgi:hypothetical protein
MKNLSCKLSCLFTCQKKKLVAISSGVAFLSKGGLFLSSFSSSKVSLVKVLLLVPEQPHSHGFLLVLPVTPKIL